MLGGGFQVRFVRLRRRRKLFSVSTPAGRLRKFPDGFCRSIVRGRRRRLKSVRK